MTQSSPDKTPDKAMRTWVVAVKDANGQVVTFDVQSWNPDDAITVLELRGDYLPQAGDVIVRCSEVRP